MAVVDIENAVQLAVQVVRDAHANKKLSQLTNRLVRQEVEKSLKLDAGTLDEKQYKKRLSETVTATVEELQSQKPSNVEFKSDAKVVQKESSAKPSSSKKKRRSMDAEAPDAKKPKSKPRTSKVADSNTADNDGKAKESSPSKPAKPTSGKKKRKEEASTEQTPKGEPKADVTVESIPPEETKGKHKSREVIMSDEDGDGGGKISAPASPVSPTSPRKQAKRPVLSESENEAEPSTLPKKRMKSSKGQSKGKETSKTVSSKGKPASTDKQVEDEPAAKEVEVQSDSELSVLLDEPPVKKGKKSRKSEGEKSEGAAKEKKSRAKKETKDSSPDEEQIKKLKSFVVACGVRKIWSKELKDCETPSSQISHLRKLLTDLGMKGRFSFEQAKSIKAKRDLAKEMEDVQEFAERYAGDRPKRSTAKAMPIEADASSDEEEEDEPSRPTKTAHRSIMDFLDDQSDSE